MITQEALTVRAMGDLKETLAKNLKVHFLRLFLLSILLAPDPVLQNLLSAVSTEGRIPPLSL